MLEVTGESTEIRCPRFQINVSGNDCFPQLGRLDFGILQPKRHFAKGNRMVHHIPEGANSVSAYLIVKDGQAALDFYAKAFGGTQAACLTAPDGSVVHGEIRIGNSTVMISQENLEWNMKSPETLGGSPVSLHVYVEDADAAYQTALDAGCTEIMPVSDMFWGDRYGKVVDPFGFQWGIATHVEDVEPEEMQRRSQAWFAQMAGGE